MIKKSTGAARAKTGRYKGMLKRKLALPSANAYPINSIKRARNALSRIAQNGTPSQQSTVRSNVHKAYPSINIGGKLRRRGK